MKTRKDSALTPAREMAVRCAGIADDKKAENILVLDIRRLTYIADYFVIATGFNSRQLQTIADDIRTMMKQAGMRQVGSAGYNDAVWILQDYGDVVVHLFDTEARQAYNLEELWAGATRVRWRMALDKLKPAQG